jgi:hypothetical protein
MGVSNDHTCPCRLPASVGDGAMCRISPRFRLPWLARALACCGSQGGPHLAHHLHQGEHPPSGPSRWTGSASQRPTPRQPGEPAVMTLIFSQVINTFAMPPPTTSYAASTRRANCRRRQWLSLFSLRACHSP